VRQQQPGDDAIIIIIATPLPRTILQWKHT
jgi:hypothetical protein